MKGNYLVHGIIMIVLAAIGWVAVAGSLPSFMDSSSMQTYMSPSSTLIMLGLHIFFGGASLIFATWLVAVWRPHSTKFAAKSKKIWQLTAIFWILAYVVGLLLYVALTTTFL
jgi:H+/Cl- antiporter ClcA